MRFRSVLIAVCCILSASGAEKFVGGKVNQGFTGRHGFEKGGLTSAQGTFLCFFKLEKPFAETDAMLFSAGSLGPGWFYLGFSKGALSFSFKNAKGSSAARLQGLELEKDKWYHLALSWGTYKEKSFVNIYLDGQCKLHQEKMEFPEKCSEGKLGLGYNTGHWVSPDFPGVIDEVAFYSIPLDAEAIREQYQAGMDGKSFPPGPGCVFYASLDGGFNVDKGPEPDAGKTKQMLRNASRKVKIQKYPDELPFTCVFNEKVKEKSPDSLNDGNEETAVFWKDRPLEIICELSHTSDVRLIEIVARKYTKWYMLKELHVSLDNGSGEFGPPQILHAYYAKTTNEAPTVDSSCRSYYYRVENPGKAVRVKIRAVGDAFMSLSEIRICGASPK